RALAQLCGDCAAESPASRPIDAVEVARRFVAAEQAGAAPPKRRLPIGRRWAITAMVAMLALGAGVARRPWWPAPGFGNGGGAGADRSLKLAGSALDVGAARRVATFEGRVRCFSMLPGGRSFRIVVGEPQRAFDVDTETGARAASPLRPETYLYGCPV